jgi:hypothetical protein
MKASTELEKESYGCCTSTSRSRSTSKRSARSPPARSSGGATPTHGAESRHLQVRPVDVEQGLQRTQLERALHSIDVGGTQLEFTDEQVLHARRHIRTHLQADGKGATPLPQELGLNGGNQVLGFTVGQVEVVVAGDAEVVLAHHLHAGEQALQVEGDHLLERDETARTWQRDKPRQQGRHLDPGEALLPAQGVAHHHSQVQ